VPFEGSPAVITPQYAMSGLLVQNVLGALEVGNAWNDRPTCTCKRLTDAVAKWYLSRWSMIVCGLGGKRRP
jgi:hypothetical protein